MAVRHPSECITWTLFADRWLRDNVYWAVFYADEPNCCPTNTRRFGDAEKVGELINRIRTPGPNNANVGEGELRADADTFAHRCRGDVLVFLVFLVRFPM